MQQEEQRKLQDTALEHRTLLEALQNVSETELAQLKETFSWEYAWKEEGAHKQKVSVSELKHRAMEERSESAEQTLNTAQPLFPDEIATPYVPRFVQVHCMEPWYTVFWNVWISQDFRILQMKSRDYIL